jgi:ubiquitin-conjugating enzyme E2 variant
MSRASEVAEPMTESISPRTKAIFDRVSVGTFAAVWFFAFFNLGPHLLENDLRMAAPLGLLAGYLLADFIAGSVHWLADRFFDPKTPVLGPMLIAPFREHHVDAMSITRHDFFEVSGNNSLVSIPLVIAILLLPHPVDFMTTFLVIFGLSLALMLVATNQFHGWAHTLHPPRFVRALHGLGLILTPERHARHHSGQHDRAYCVTSGWLNPVLDGLRFFERIENLIAGSTRNRKRMT